MCMGDDELKIKDRRHYRRIRIVHFRTPDQTVSPTIVLYANFFSPVAPPFFALLSHLFFHSESLKLIRLATYLPYQ